MKKTRKNLPVDQWPDSKICNRCGVIKRLDEFSRGDSLYKRQGRCKECLAEYNRQHYIANKVNHLATQKLWKQANPDWMKHYYQENMEHIKRLGRDYQKANADKLSASKYARRARIKGIEGFWTDEEWQFLLGLCDHRCVKCGTHQNDLSWVLEKDHIVPTSIEGATNWITNLQPLCKPCNSSKQHRDSVDHRPDIVREQIYGFIMSKNLEGISS